jgi:thioredoxin 1
MMKCVNMRNLGKMVAACGAIVMAAMSFGAATSTPSVAKPPAGQANKDGEKRGDAVMLTVQQPGKVHHADEANFEQLVLNSDVPVLVDFYADWCGPCRMVSPVLEELAQETKDAKVVKVNIDRSPRLAVRYGVSSIPNMKVFDEGKVVDEHVGLANKRRLKKMLDI